MIRVTLRGFFARRLRALLTGVAIALGVALMAGTYILTDTINGTFDGIFQTANRGHDVVVTPHRPLGRTASVETPPIPAATVARVRAVPGVAEASGSIFSTVNLLSGDGKQLSTGGAPAFVTAPVPKRFESFESASGHLPRSAGQVAIDQSTANRFDLKLGDAIEIAGAAPAHRYTIVGITRFAGSENFGGAAAAMVTLEEAQRAAGEPGAFDQIDVAAIHGVTPQQLRTRIRAALPRSLDVRTGQQQAQQSSSDLRSQLGFLRTFLLIFAYVALLVGAFIIFNTFSITVAQRTREFGLLRTLGATRRQLLRAVVGEGVLMGLIGSGIGLLIGIGLAPALDGLFKAFGADLPDSGTVLLGRTVWVCILAGTVVAVLASIVPALRATRVSPVAALREGVPLMGRRSQSARRKRVAIAVAVGIVVWRVVTIVTTGEGLALSIVLLVLSALYLRTVLRTGRVSWVSQLVPLLGRALGRLVTWRGVTGRIARDNSIRQPGRTAATAAALMIGLALVTFVSILADGLKASIDNAVDRSFAGSLIVENSQQNSPAGIPSGLVDALEKVPGVRAVTGVAFTEGKVRGIGSNAKITAVDPASFPRIYKIGWARGSDAVLTALGAGGVIVNKTYAKNHHLNVGERIAVTTPTSRHLSLTIRGIVVDDSRLLTDLTITRELASTAFAQRSDAFDFLTYEPGANGAATQRAVDRLLAQRYPQARSRTAKQFKADLAGQVNSLLVLIYVLLTLSVIVSLLGIVNTLVLSVYERTRELGLLRAIGASRRQVREVIRFESIITALIGGVLGIVLGIVIALISNAALSGSGFILSIPVGTLVVLLILAAIAGVIAAAWPARRAARVDVLRALTME